MRSHRLATGLLARAAIAALAIAGFAIVSQAPAKGGKDSDNVVVCFNRAAPNGGLPKAVYRTTPGRCMFVRRGQQPIDASSVTTRNLRWRRWGKGHARARGNEIVNTVGRVRVVVQLFNVRNRCGNRVFTRARFRSPRTGDTTTLTLDPCK